MRSEPPYAEQADLLIGEARLPAVVSKDEYLNKAANEIDIALGQTYVVPIDITSNDVSYRAKLMLNKINSHLASGRLLMAASAATSDDSLHAYAQSLIAEAMADIQMVKFDTDALEGVELVPSTDDRSGPSIIQQDEKSPVDGFYDYFVNPGNGYPTNPYQKDYYQPGVAGE